MEDLELKEKIDSISTDIEPNQETNMEDLELKKEIDSISTDTEPNQETDGELNNTTALIEYREIEEPCVALTIIGETRLSNAGVFMRRGVKFSFKAFFSTLVLTIMNMFI